METEKQEPRAMTDFTQKQIKSFIDDLAYVHHKWGRQMWMSRRENVVGWLLLKRKDGSWWAVLPEDFGRLVDDEGMQNLAVKSIVPSQISAHQEMTLKKKAREYHQ